MAVKRLDKEGKGVVEYADFEAYWLEMFSGEYVRGEKLADAMAQFADAEHIEGVACTTPTATSTRTMRCARGAGCCSRRSTPTMAAISHTVE